MNYSFSIVGRALLLTLLGAAGTALGGLVIVVSPTGPPSFRNLGLIQGLAAGLMLCISMLDLMPSAVNALGFPVANFCFFGGVAFFAVVAAFVPEPQPTSLLGAGARLKAKDSGPDLKTGRRASVSGTGSHDSLIEFEFGKIGGGPPKPKHHRRQQVLASGLITALGIALHNFPEGIAVFLASIKGGSLGLTLALAIALHNIPEGIAVAMPVYFATNSRWEAMKLTVISGLAEPAGVILVGLLFPVNLSEHLVECMLAAVAGIMAFLTVHELMPLAIEHAGRRDATFVVFLGMAIMSLSLHW
eukprot:CAMPEP_0114287348 /NCGR_PEP_ID=MMETSP0059-20121206/6231_1 /TAXON_ID=36894 /ORGANISM="Pyramimonas parkeae, Strain CCMP726" /LENGTH=301 /DNA_ID=CAMNT_0001408425 /DNA_START=273 /DNA_END=1175 /DNA_ORIENTATION=-